MNLPAQISQLCQSPLPRILMLSHGIGGGVARHIEELAQVLQGRAHVALLQPHSTRRLISVRLPPVQPQQQPVQLAFRWPQQSVLLWRFLKQLGISRAHVHHVLGLRSDFWQEFLELQLPFDLTLHDHSIFALATEQSAAQQPWLQQQLQACLSGRSGHAQNLGLLATQAKRILVPSAAMLRQLQQYCPQLPMERFQHCPHPDAENPQAWPQPFSRPLQPQQPLRVLCLGMLSAEKGARVLAKVATLAQQQNAAIAFHLLGSCHVHLPKNVQRHGSYLDDEILHLLATLDPHLLWLPAQCPETWSYTLSTGLVAGLPVLTTDIGVFPERLAQRPLSWLHSHQYSAEEWLAVLQQIRQLHLDETVALQPWSRSVPSAFYTGVGYLQALTAVPVLPATSTPLNTQQINQALVRALPAPRHWRSLLLRGMVLLKHMPLLAPFVRLIPYRWQRRLKRMISREPIHDPRR